jgi:hypothetical protein
MDKNAKMYLKEMHHQKLEKSKNRKFITGVIYVNNHSQPFPSVVVSVVDSA